VSSRRISGDREHLLGQRPLDDRDLAVEELDLTQAGRDGLLLIGGQLLRSQPAPSAHAEEVAHRRLALQVADQRRVHLVLRARALPDQLRPSRDPTTEDPCLFIRQPDRGQKAAGKQLRMRACVDLVALRARTSDPLTAFEFASTTQPTCGSMIRAISSAFPVTSSATSSSPPRL
jgi:hypothetical protein